MGEPCSGCSLLPSVVAVEGEETTAAAGAAGAGEERAAGAAAGAGGSHRNSTMRGSRPSEAAMPTAAIWG